jgi:hypothetical protein
MLNFSSLILLANNFKHNQSIKSINLVNFFVSIRYSMRLEPSMLPGLLQMELEYIGIKEKSNRHKKC